MKKFIFDGGNFGAVLDAVHLISYSKYQATDVELIFDYTAENCVLRNIETGEILATIPN